MPLLSPMKSISAGILLLSCLFMVTQSLHAQNVEKDTLKAQVSTWKKQFDQLDIDLQKNQIDDERLEELTVDIQKSSVELEAFIEKNEPLATDARTLLDKLGKPPKKGEPPESEDIAKQRKELEKRFAQSDGLIKSATSLLARSKQMHEFVHDLRRRLFREQILHKGRSPFSLSLWREGVPELSKASAKIARILGYWSERHNTGPLALLALAALLVGAGLYKLMARGIENYRRWPAGRSPPFFKQASTAAIVSLMRAAPPVAGAGLFYGGLHTLEMLSSPVDQLAPIALGAFSSIAALLAMSTTLLAPNHRHWRIFPVSSSVARRLNMLLLAIALVYGVDLFLGALNRIFLLPLSLTILQSAIASVVFAGLLVAILHTPFKAHRLAAKASRKSPGHLSQLLKIPLWLIVLAVLAATALGYISLARFLTQQTVVSGSILIIAYLVHRTIG